MGVTNKYNDVYNKIHGSENWITSLSGKEGLISKMQVSYLTRLMENRKPYLLDKVTE